jgi:hypothetical protein
MGRGRTGCCEGEEWILVQEKEGSEGSESRDEKEVRVGMMVNLIV